ncbi:hypothetical protein JW992_06465 [candidate division KSB1 bacterium]|nr:hypothetical protein [candidate division KSB1 bacterium]
MKRFIKPTVGALLGAAGGYAYYYFIGCRTGTCPITANPWISTLYGSLIGFVLVFPSRKKSAKQDA